MRHCLLISAVAVLLLVVVCLSSTTEAQNLTNWTNCIADGGNYFQWSIDTRASGTKYIRARYIKANGRGGWAAVGFRYGRRWDDPNSYDPNNEAKPNSMGESTLPSTSKYLTPSFFITRSFCSYYDVFIVVCAITTCVNHVMVV